MKLTKGFDSNYKNLWDFIVKITHYIWEERNVDSIRKFYHKDIKVHLSDGFTQGVDSVVNSTFEMLGAFPDRRLLPEDVIASAEENEALYSSHRIINTMTKTGDGLFGEVKEKNYRKKKFGRKITVRGIADCLVKKNQVIEEWLIRDVSGLLTGLGIDFKIYAKKQASKNFAALKNKKPWHQKKYEEKAPKLSKNQEKAKNLSDAKNYAEMLKTIWEQGILAKIKENYHLAARVEVPNNQTLYGQEMLEEFYFRYLGALSEVSFRIEHLAQENLPESPKKLAVRWSIVAKHTGWGALGEPCSGPLYIMGISHAYLCQGKIVAEWMIMDEVAIFKQIFLNFLINNNK